MSEQDTETVDETEEDASLAECRNGMKSLGKGIIALAVLQFVLGGLLATTFGPAMLIMVIGLGAIDLVMGLLLLRNQGWVNHLVAFWSGLLLAANLVMLGLQGERREGASNVGTFLGMLLAGVLFHYAARNIRTLRKARAAGLSVAEGQWKWRYRLPLALAPVAVAVATVYAGMLFPAKIDPAAWKRVAPSRLGFYASMPGTPLLEESSQETPNGAVEIHKFTVVPTGRREMFVIVSLCFPEVVSLELDGTEALLEGGREDVLTAFRAQLSSEERIVSNGWPGLKLQALAPKGAMVEAKIYATNDRIFEVVVHVPKNRAGSDDVRKFLDSFALSARRDAEPDRGVKE